MTFHHFCRQFKVTAWEREELMWQLALYRLRKMFREFARAQGTR
jgi:hypothetical protein